MIAADLALLAHDDATGRPMVDQYKLDAALTAAVVMDLILTGVVKLDDHSEVRRERRFAVTATPVNDPLLADVVTRLDGKKLKSGIQSVYQRRGTKLRKAVLEQLVTSGDLLESERRILGIFPRTDHPAGAVRREEQLRATLAAALDGPLPPDQRTTALLGILSAADLVRKVFPERDRKATNERIKELTGGDWIGEAVGAAIAAVQGAVMAGAVVASS